MTVEKVETFNEVPFITERESQDDAKFISTLGNQNYKLKI